MASGGKGLLSPHHLGYPQHRERFFAVASLEGLPEEAFPSRDRSRLTSMTSIVQQRDDLSESDYCETLIADQHRRCIDHWNAFLDALPEEKVALPSFPIWGDEFNATYSYDEISPWAQLLAATFGLVHSKNGKVSSREDFEALPSYARTKVVEFPKWKVRFIRSNRDWFASIRDNLSPEWLSDLRTFPPSLRKLEWNCQGEERNLWKHILQFRPSGLRVKRYANSPSLVAMTSTQIPILGPEQRHLSRVEGLRLQGFDDDFCVPESRTATFKALGNAVHR